MEVLWLAKPALGLWSDWDCCQGWDRAAPCSRMPLSCDAGKVRLRGVGAPETLLFARGQVWAAQQGPQQAELPAPPL